MNIIQARCGGTLHYLCIPSIWEAKVGDRDLGQPKVNLSQKNEMRNMVAY